MKIVDDVEFACPTCGARLSGGERDRACERCGRTATRIAPGLWSWDSEPHPSARAILAWPDEFVARLADQAMAGPILSNRDEAWIEELRGHELVDSAGAPTRLGSDVNYHLAEHRWQQGRKGLDGLLALEDLGTSVRVLDVGTGAGQTLRQLDPERVASRVGIDVDPSALALGSRLGTVDGVPLTLMAASAEALPFPEASFDLVLTRVALNYMRQAHALAEMARVLRPGGVLFCRVERAWHDLSMLRYVRSPKALACRLRDLGNGLALTLAGIQAAPGTRFLGGRAFASGYRLRAILRRNGCATERVEESPNGPVFLGRRTQLVVVARKL